MKFVVLGAGLGGQLAVVGLKRVIPDCEIVLVGPETAYPTGLFYFNERVAGVAEREILVQYEKSGDCSWEEYQFKSRGSVSSDVKKSSFSKVGKTELGYLLNEGKINLEGLCQRVTGLCTKILSETKQVVVATGHEFRKIDFDYLISTIPYNKLIRSLKGKTVDDCLKYSPIYIKNEVDFPQDILNQSTRRIVVEYDCNLENPEYRINKYYDKSGNLLMQSSESIKETDDYTTILYPGKIIPTESVYAESASSLESQFPWLKIYGRYARWDYHYLVTDTYNDVIKFGLGLTTTS